MFSRLTNCPATFQWMMDTIFTIPITQGWLKIYMDNLLIANTSNRKDITEKMLKVLKLLKENDLFIKPEKCSFYKNKVDFLGFIIEEEKIKMNPTKLKGILKWPAPQNLTQLQSFIGLCNFYHQFINHHSNKCTPLNLLLKKTQLWKWEQDQQVAFETLKAAYASQPILLCLDYLLPFRIECDASKFATRGVLLQDNTNRQEHPVAYFSKSLAPAKKNYMTYNREFLAIILCLRKWCHFVIGSPYATVIFTDHQNLTYFQGSQQLTGWQIRWVVELIEYNIKVQHKAGRQMIVTDSLSRRPDYIWSF